MKIEATIDHTHNRVFIPLPVLYGEGKVVIINFLIDTGATTTTLGFLDVEKLIDTNATELPHHPESLLGIGGNVDTRVLKGYLLILTPNGDPLKKYSEMPVSVPKLKMKGKKLSIEDPKVRQKLAAVFPSLLGIDIIMKGELYINFEDDEAYLDIP